MPQIECERAGAAPVLEPRKMAPTRPIPGPHKSPTPPFGHRPKFRPLPFAPDAPQHVGSTHDHSLGLGDLDAWPWPATGTKWWVTNSDVVGA